MKPGYSRRPFVKKEALHKINELITAPMVRVVGEIKANAVKQEIKEIRFGPNTDEHDVDFKIKHSKHFLEQGHKVRAYVFFRGRSIIYKQRGIDLLMGYANVLIDEGYAKLESEPKEEGKKVAIMLAPKVKK